MTWLADPATGEPLGPIPGEREWTRQQMLIRTGHWGGKEGWLTGIERDSDGTPLRMWFRQCGDQCCAEYRANLPPLESLR